MRTRALSIDQPIGQAMLILSFATQRAFVYVRRNVFGGLFGGESNLAEPYARILRRNSVRRSTMTSRWAGLAVCLFTRGCVGCHFTRRDAIPAHLVRWCASCHTLRRLATLRRRRRRMHACRRVLYRGAGSRHECHRLCSAGKMGLQVPPRSRSYRSKPAVVSAPVVSPTIGYDRKRPELLLIQLHDRRNGMRRQQHRRLPD